MRSSSMKVQADSYTGELTGGLTGGLTGELTGGYLTEKLAFRVDALLGKQSRNGRVPVRHDHTASP